MVGRTDHHHKLPTEIFSIVEISLKPFDSKVYLHNSNFLLTLSYSLCKEHTPQDISLYVPCDLIHHQSK
uniref:Uncharacterized protein n=1 Tax=Arundo donax TaxID=35708 RepID=A0A0A8XRC5_ARUDO